MGVGHPEILFLKEKWSFLLQNKIDSIEPKRSLANPDDSDIDSFWMPMNTNINAWVEKQTHAIILIFVSKWFINRHVLPVSPLSLVWSSSTSSISLIISNNWWFIKIARIVVSSSNDRSGFKKWWMNKYISSASKSGWSMIFERKSSFSSLNCDKTDTNNIPISANTFKNITREKSILNRLK